MNGYNWIQVVSSCIHLYPPSRTCIYVHPFVSDTKCICIHLYPRVEHCSTLDTFIHLYPLVSPGVNANWIQVDTNGYIKVAGYTFVSVQVVSRYKNVSRYMYPDTFLYPIGCKRALRNKYQHTLTSLRLHSGMFN